LDNNHYAASLINAILAGKKPDLFENQHLGPKRQESFAVLMVFLFVFVMFSRVEHEGGNFFSCPLLQVFKQTGIRQVQWIRMFPVMVDNVMQTVNDGFIMYFYG
jgi:hypothetical protein